MVMTEQISRDERSSWTWPFSRAQLTAGMRRYFEDTTLQVEDVRPRSLTYRRPGIGRLHGREATNRGSAGAGELSMVIKEPHGSTRTGLAGAGRREVGVYESLA